MHSEMKIMITEDNCNSSFLISPPADFTIEVFRLEEIDKSMFRDYQRYDFHQVLWFTRVEGGRRYEIDFKEFLISAGQIVVIYPRQIEKLDITGKAGFLFAIANDVFLAINQKIKSGYLNGYFSNVFIEAGPALSGILGKIMELLLLEYEGYNRNLLKETYLQSFLFHISSAFRDESLLENKDTLLFVKLVELVDSHFTENREVSFFAGKLNVSEKKLNQICKKMYGRTTKQLIQERLVLEIKRELRLGLKSLKEIAFELGFSEQAYFSRFFRRHVSVSPGEFLSNR